MIQTGEKGAVLITVAISLLLLMGVAALAVDGGMAYNERRFTQGAADNAALAGAWAMCQGDDPIQAALDSAEVNGFVDGVQPDVDDGFVTVAITSDVKATFGRSQNVSDITVASQAVASCTVQYAGGPYALFSIGETCKLTQSGRFEINGDVHSNYNLESGRGTTNGVTTYVGSHQPDNGQPMTFNPSIGQSSTRPDPVGLDISTFIPGAIDTDGDDITDNWLLGNGTPRYAIKDKGDTVLQRSGVYYTSGSIHLNKLKMGPDVKATFVSEGPIKITSATFEAYHESGVALFSNYNRDSDSCGQNDPAIHITWSSAEWTGLLYAPNGSINLNISQANTLDGAIVARNVYLNGSNGHTTTITNNTPMNASPVYVVRLEE